MMKRLIWLLPIAVALLILFLLQTVFLIGYVPSASMEPTLKENSFIVGVRLYKELESGDIVVFEHNGSLMVKRIAACPGEEITVDGIRYCVPEDSYLMLGDNVENSYDSRFWEVPYVTESNIVAKVICP